jgi:hypothetical protein
MIQIEHGKSSYTGTLTLVDNDKNIPVYDLVISRIITYTTGKTKTIQKTFTELEPVLDENKEQVMDKDNKLVFKEITTVKDVSVESNEANLKLETVGKITLYADIPNKTAKEMVTNWLLLNMRK